MEDKSLELLSEEGHKFHDEFTRCQNIEEIYELEKRWKKLNESRGEQPIPHYNMTFDEFCKKYNATPYEEMEKRMWGK